MVSQIGAERQRGWYLGSITRKFFYCARMTEYARGRAKALAAVFSDSDSPASLGLRQIGDEVLGIDVEGQIIVRVEEQPVLVVAAKDGIDQFVGPHTGVTL